MNVLTYNQQRRTIRKFNQKPIDESLLTQFVDTARLCPSAGNFQPLRYRIVSRKDDCDALFPHLKWAAYLPDGTPAPQYRPTAYIVIAQDLSIRSADASLDAGAAAMTINLCAQEHGISACWIGSVDRKAVSKMYDLDEKMKILLVLALGYPAQESTAVPVKDENIRYYEDENHNIYVPKRSLTDVLF